jgi:hypothetical protein
MKTRHRSALRSLSLKINFSKPYFAKTGFPSTRNMGGFSLIMQGEYHVHGLDPFFAYVPITGISSSESEFILFSSHHTKIIESSKQTMQNTCASIQLINSSGC